MKSADRLAVAALALIWAALATLLAPFIAVSPITILATLYGLACAWNGAFSDSVVFFEFATLFYQLLLRLSAATFLAFTVGSCIVLTVVARVPALDESPAGARGIALGVPFAGAVAVTGWLVVGGGTADLWIMLPLFWAILYAAIESSRSLLPGSGRGEIAEPVRALRRLAGHSLLPWLGALTLGAAWVAWSTRVETLLILPCEVEGEGCLSVEPVRSRGLPMPFIQRRFEPGVFLYDLSFATLLAALPVSVLTWARGRRRRPAEPARASLAHVSSARRAQPSSTGQP